MNQSQGQDPDHDHDHAQCQDQDQIQDQTSTQSQASSEVHNQPQEQSQSQSSRMFAEVTDYSKGFSPNFHMLDHKPEVRPVFLGFKKSGKGGIQDPTHTSSSSYWRCGRQAECGCGPTNEEWLANLC